MSRRKDDLIALGNIHGFRIKGSEKKYDTIKDAMKKDAASSEPTKIVVYGKSKAGVVRKKKCPKTT